MCFNLMSEILDEWYSDLILQIVSKRGHRISSLWKSRKIVCEDLELSNLYLHKLLFEF